MTIERDSGEKDGRLPAADAPVTALSPSGSSPSVSPAAPLQSTGAGSERIDVRAFEEFCRGKPARKRYDYMNAESCPATQFGRHAGVIADGENLYDHKPLRVLHDSVFAVITKYPNTFSALATRLSRIEG